MRKITIDTVETQINTTISNELLQQFKQLNQNPHEILADEYIIQMMTFIPNLIDLLRKIDTQLDPNISQKVDQFLKQHQVGFNDLKNTMIQEDAHNEVVNKFMPYKKTLADLIQLLIQEIKPQSNQPLSNFKQLSLNDYLQLLNIIHDSGMLYHMDDISVIHVKC